MPWQIKKRNIGRAGGVRRREAKQREWDLQYGEGCWEIGYVINGVFITQDDAIESVYDASYAAHFERNPGDLRELIRTAKVLRNPHAAATSGVDLQVPAIMRYLSSHGLELLGSEVVDIGTWEGRRSHAISERLSPLQIQCCLNPRFTLEKYWQSKKCLAVWTDE